MKWPWVSRALYEASQREAALLRQERDQAYQNISDLWRAKDELVAEALRMKRAGYEPTPKEPDPEPPIALPPEVEAAIEERAVDTASRRLLTRYAMTELRREEATAESVAAKVLVGEDVDELMP